MTKEIHNIPSFNKAFSQFLNKHDKIILKLFNIIASFKKDIPNTYKYSSKYPPKRSIYKYTDKLFVGCILYIILNNMSWISFIGPIPGKQVHKKFKEYIKKYNCFEILFNESVEKYICTKSKEKLNIISVDSSAIYNKLSTEIRYKNPFLKNKKCLKVTSLVDCEGTPLNIIVTDGNKHDSKILKENFTKILVNNRIKEKLSKNSILLADKGYDSKIIRNKLKNANIKSIIGYNKRNTKDKTKLRSLTKRQNKIYKNRIKVEHYFGIIKRYPKINNVYEKSLESYLNIILFASAKLIINRT